MPIKTMGHNVMGNKGWMKPRKNGCHHQTRAGGHMLTKLLHPSVQGHWRSRSRWEYRERNIQDVTRMLLTRRTQYVYTEYMKTVCWEQRLLMWKLCNCYANYKRGLKLFREVNPCQGWRIRCRVISKLDISVPKLLPAGIRAFVSYKGYLCL